MEKSRRRAMRRSYADRKLKRARKMVANWFWGDRYSDEALIRLMARKRRDNMQTCSRPCCCGNPRRGRNNRLERLTIAELRSDDSFKDMTLELEGIEDVGSQHGHQTSNGNSAEDVQ